MSTAREREQEQAVEPVDDRAETASRTRTGDRSAEAPVVRTATESTDGGGPGERPGRERRGALAGGALPRWAPWSVFGAAAAVAVLLAVAGASWFLLAIGVVLVSSVVVYAWSRSVEGPRRAKDRVVTIVVSSAFAVAIAPLISLLWTVTSRGLDRFDAELFTGSMRGVIGDGGGIVHAITGTLVITATATVISVPIGVMAAIYLQEYGKGRLKRWLTFFVDVMTGIPSIVAGLFAYSLFVLIMGPGVRLGVMGAVALSVLMIPIVVRSTEEMLRVVPQALREASFALGVPKWRTVTKVVLPTAFAGIVTGVMISVARIIGETAPLLITAGITTSTNWNPFDGRMANLAVFAYDQYSNPGVPRDPFIARAWAAALTLLLIVMVLFFLARLVSARFGVKTR